VSESSPTAPERPHASQLSSSGDDSFSGTLPASTGVDGPFRTLAGARDVLAALRAEGELDRPVEVWIEGGTWALTETWTFSPEDGGTRDNPVTWTA
jgi:hypothetical protein